MRAGGRCRERRDEDDDNAKNTTARATLAHDERCTDGRHDHHDWWLETVDGFYGGASCPPIIAWTLLDAFTESRDEASSLPVEKARSTAEEFNEHAKEMADSVAHNAKEAFEGAKEVVVGESEQDKEKFKEKVEKGKYDKMGED
ncbi:hypothetical protein QJS10_CPA08g01612 [Acorus calamus]|uniref:Uncharacterized protein n=1 Tax=Acorus calamus TaxID=4465 RepID=A0AAV9ECI0_ACOCL|nr:hypothetical protein QJS10_CPA08g01612 [Acorus calamus]